MWIQFGEESVANDVASSNFELPDDEPPDDQSALRSLSILLVENDDDWRRMLTHVLEYYGALVFPAVNAWHALDILEVRDPDVLVADLHLPGYDGCWLIGEVRKRTDLLSEIPAASISAIHRLDDRDRAIKAGYQMHLQKPIEPWELVSTVLTLAARATGPSANQGGHRRIRQE